MQQSFLPTPAKFHYLFNLRDVSRVFQGVCSVTPETLRSLRPVHLIGLWQHECLRVFSDKLLSTKDKEQAKQIVQANCLHFFESRRAEIKSELVEKELLFANFL